MGRQTQMPRLTNDQFLIELDLLYKSVEQSGTLYITYKQYYEVDQKQIKGGKRKADNRGDGESCCLVRARNNNKKISTVIHGKDYIRFHRSLQTVQRGHMTGLKKREKKKREPRAKKE